jgi:hypothetical protein
VTTQEYLERLGALMPEVKRIARAYKLATGRPLGITGEVAEYEAIRLLGLDVCDVRQAGYDATCTNRQYARIQIKGRSLLDGTKNGRLGKIDIGKEWDSVVLVMLDESLNPLTIHEAGREAIVAAIMKPGSKSRNERWQLAISQFKAIAEVVWRAQPA